MINYKENRKRWIEALRSGKYKQGKGFLNCNGGFCCLGVACEIFKDELKINFWGVSYYGTYNGHSKVLPIEVIDYLGLDQSIGAFENTSLINLNDTENKTFQEIADIIESEPKGLFIS